MGTSALSAETLMLAGIGMTYDTAFKLIFSEKSVLAFILRDCVGGYDGMTPREIERYITYGPVAHSIPIAPGLTNAPGSPLFERGGEPTSLRGSRTEDKVPYEGQTAFDFYFEATAPQDGTTVGIHVNVEGQAAYDDGTYPMEHRAQFYASRRPEKSMWLGRWHTPEKRALLPYSLVAIALMNSSLSRVWGLGSVVMRARSPVIWPASMVSSVAFSSRSAKATRSGRPSSSPRLRRAPDQAKIVATELVEVFSPLRCL